MNTPGNYASRRTEQDVMEALKHFKERSEAVSYLEIANHLGCAPLTVINAVGRLLNKGEIEVENTKGKPNRYRIMKG